MFKVLVVDDSEINLTLFKHLIDRFETCESISYTDPLRALDWSRRNEPDLVIVDYMMPGMDGLHFLAEFRKLHAQDAVPTLMVTANDDKTIRYQALGEGASDYLTKPVDRHEFSARVRNLLALRQNHRYLTERADWLAAEVAKATREILTRERETVTRISRAAEFRDPETGAHIQRMAHYSCLIAATLGLSAAEQEEILAASPLHDVGKIGIPDAILLKPGRLTPEEFAIMKQHAAYGHELLAGSASRTVQLGAEIAHTHHEKFDGSGYPNGLVGDAIPLVGRIVAVADVFDALTSERPYKKAWALDRALAQLREGAGRHFDPRCVDAFIASWDRVLEIRQRFQDHGDDDPH